MTFSPHPVSRDLRCHKKVRASRIHFLYVMAGTWFFRKRTGRAFLYLLRLHIVISILVGENGRVILPVPERKELIINLVHLTVFHMRKHLNTVTFGCPLNCFLITDIRHREKTGFNEAV